MPAAAARAGREHPKPKAPGRRTGLLRVAGAGLLTATAAIHLDLYLTGYRTIPTIGRLFLLQLIAAFGLGVTVLVIPGRLVVPGRLAAAAGAGFALATLGGYLLSVWIGLFGFKEILTTAGIIAGVIEVAAFAVLAVLARPRAAIARAAGVATAALAIAALVLLGVTVAGATSTPPAATGTGTTLKTTSIGGATVLTNAQGFTVYLFAPDTRTTSKCYGSCAAYWPPVTGTAAASPGVPGRVGTITRTDGSRQLTYNGHPLYTYIADTAPGLARGNNINLNGGLWREVLASR